MSILRNVVEKTFLLFNAKVIHCDTYKRLIELEADVELLTKKSRSQLMQDLFVLYELNFKRNGYFVDFGATNGVSLSNSYLLEKEFEWKGILAEPAKCWHDDLRKNRVNHIETNCVWRDSISVLSFNEVDNPEFSTISDYNASDVHTNQRNAGHSYEVNTISLTDLLDKYAAPKVIDYLSIDTEGSEYDILKNFDFDKYKFRVITVEHNYTSNRELIYNLLIENGYSRKYLGFSKWDDWYVNLDL